MDDKANPMIFKVTPAPVEIDAKTFGVQLVNDYADKQAAILCHMKGEITNHWRNGMGAWAFQCREIASAMTDTECDDVRRMLELLTEHLEAIPSERRAEKMAGQICDAVKAAIQE